MRWWATKWKEKLKKKVDDLLENDWVKEAYRELDLLDSGDFVECPECHYIFYHKNGDELVQKCKFSHTLCNVRCPNKQCAVTTFCWWCGEKGWHVGCENCDEFKEMKRKWNNFQWYTLPWIL